MPGLIFGSTQLGGYNFYKCSTQIDLMTGCPIGVVKEKGK